MIAKALRWTHTGELNVVGKNFIPRHIHTLRFLSPFFFLLFVFSSFRVIFQIALRSRRIRMRNVIRREISDFRNIVIQGQLK